MFWAMIEAEDEVGKTGLTPPQYFFYWPFQGGAFVVARTYLLS